MTNLLDFIVPVSLFAISTSITPGPNNIMIMTSGLNFGVQRSLPHYLGICIGFPFMVLLVGSGMGLVFDRFPLIHDLIKLLGIVYMLYLAWKIAHSAETHSISVKVKPITFWQAVLFQWVNPKAWIMATGAVAAFTSLNSDIYLQILLIASAFFFVSFPSTGIWLVFGVWLKNILKSYSHQRLFNRFMAALLVISILPVAFETGAR